MTVDPTLAALGCALFYGTSTYLGGRAAVHIGPTRAVGIFQITGFLLALALCAIAGANGSLSPPSVKDGLLALVSGLCFAIGWIFLAKGLARGRTTIVAPIESLTSVGLCAAVEGLLIGWPGQELGVGIALAAGQQRSSEWGRRSRFAPWNRPGTLLRWALLLARCSACPT